MRIIRLFLILAIFSCSSLISQEDIAEYEKRLIKISQQIGELKAKIEEEEKRESTILSDLDRIGFNKNLLKKQISLYNIQSEKTKIELLSIKKSVPPLKLKLKQEQQSIEKTLVTLYKFGKFSFFEFMLKVKDTKTFLSESKNLSFLAQYQDKVISDYTNTLTQLREAEDIQKRKTEDLSLLVEKDRKKTRELEDQEKKYKALINEIKRDKKAHMKTLEELKDRANQLQTLLIKLAKEEMVFPFPLLPLYEKKGDLPWPLEGKIITNYGLQKHPEFKTVTINNGIEISPQSNELIIKSIHSGKVVYADYFKGYGNLIIIDHGLTYYSLYGHCTDFMVEKGDLIKPEQPIAIVSDFGSLKGISLYFEIRQKTKPLDPLQWLKRR